MKLFKITRWPAVLVFILAGAMTALFAFVTVNLFTQAMASYAFLGRHGWDAIRFGALWQVGELVLSGAVALACWLVFKFCEQELAMRYGRWSRKGARRRKDADRGADKARARKKSED